MNKLIIFVNDVVKPFLQQKERQRFLTGALSAFILQIFGVGGAYLIQVLLANWMDGAEFGSYIYTYNWANLLAIFGGLGLTLSVLKFVPDYIANNDWGRLRGAILAFSIIVVVGSIGISTLAYIMFSLFPPKDILLITLLLGLLMIPLVALSVLYTEILRGMDFIIFAYAPLSVGQHILLIIFAGGVFYALNNLFSYQVVMLWGIVLSLIVLFQIITILHKLPIESRGVSRIYELKEWMQTSLPMLFIRGASVLMDRIDILMVGFLLGAVPTGIYAVASRTANLTSFALSAVNAVTAPRISPLYNQGKMDELERIAKRATIISMSVSLVFFIGLVLAADLLLSFFGPEFLVGKQILIILGVAQLINASVGPVGFLMHLTNHQNISGRIYGISVVLNCVLNLLFIQGLNMGIEGAAWGTAITLVFQNLWMLWAVRQNLNINPLPFG
ncbi:MAG: oligosaccharide flippase family protein [Chloroflexota bacterium]